MNTKPIILTAPVFEDFRGYLAVPYDKSINFNIRQINQGYSKKAYTLRGLHFQEGEYARAKLVSCLHGSIFNVAVDLRPGEAFGHAYSEVLSFENRKQMYIPRGFAHGYLTEYSCAVGSSAIIRYYCYIPCTSTLLQATACHIFHTLYVLSFLICY